MLKISYNNHKQLDTTDLFKAYNGVDIEKINMFKKLGVMMEHSVSGKNSDCN